MKTLHSLQPCTRPALGLHSTMGGRAPGLHSNPAATERVQECTSPLKGTALHPALQHSEPAPSLNPIGKGSNAPLVADRHVARGGGYVPWTPADEDLAAMGALGEVLEAARLAAELTPLQLALRTGISPSSIRQIERGGYRPRPPRIRAWCEATSIDPEPLFREFARAIAADKAGPLRLWEPRQPLPPLAWSGPSLSQLRRLAPPPDVAPGERATLGTALWRLRVEARLTRSDLAYAIDCPRNHVWRIERDRRRPSRELLERWCAGLGKPELAAFLLAFEPSSIAPTPVLIRAGDHLAKTEPASPASLAPKEQPSHAPTDHPSPKGVLIR